jgi:hypothetical protein
VGANSTLNGTQVTDNFFNGIHVKLSKYCWLVAVKLDEQGDKLNTESQTVRVIISSNKCRQRQKKKSETRENWHTTRK